MLRLSVDGVRYGLRLLVLAAAAILSTASASRTGPRGYFTDTGFRSDYGYQIPYREGTKELLPKGWEQENTRKYFTSYRLDRDRDGKVDSSFKESTFALRFEHASHAGVIWLRTVPLDERLRGKELRVLMQTHLDAVAGGNYEAVELDTTQQTLVVERRYAAITLDRGSVVVARREGYRVTVDLANIDQIKVDPAARERRVQLVIVRAPQDRETTLVDDPVGTHDYPVLMIAGYSNLPEDFDKGLADFHGLLGKITIDGKSGYQPSMRSVTPTTPAPDESADD